MVVIRQLLRNPQWPVEVQILDSWAWPHRRVPRELGEITLAQAYLCHQIYVGLQDLGLGATGLSHLTVAPSSPGVAV